MEFNRNASVIWKGDSRSGSGTITTESRALFEQPYTYKTRFDGGEVTGTNPEELIAAAHAACFSMALAGTLKRNDYDPKQIDTNATCTIVSTEHGYEITRMQLHVRAQIPSIKDEAFQKLVKEAGDNCPVSKLLHKGLKIEIDATLI
jgi:osmotically inducible protein OsmC